MNKVASYLGEHLDGEVLVSNSARRYFSTDASVLTLTPTMAVYPANTNDVRKVTRFAWQLAEKGHVLPITARGFGTDPMGAAIGKGIILALPAHMNQLLEMDTKQKLARVQPGMTFQTLQNTMQTHGLFLPPYPASASYSSIGGAIANNASGEKSLKYGTMRKWVSQLEVVLANGEVIQTSRLSKRDLNRKKGLSTFEGEIYRQLDGIISDNWTAMAEYNAKLNKVTKNSSGYGLGEVKRSDGSFDLTPLIVGSQGTLGIVTEAIVSLTPYAPRTELIVAEFKSLSDAVRAVGALLPLEPSACEMVDRHLLEFVKKHHASRLKDLSDKEDLPAVVLLVEFDDLNERHRKKKSKKAQKALKDLASNVIASDDYTTQQRLWGLRHSAATVINYNEDHRAALPIIEDGIVPRESFEKYVDGVYELLKKHHLDIAVWGHAGDANLHMQPLMDISKVGDRQKIFKLMAEYYELVLKLGGSVSAEHNDGRLRAPFAAKQQGKEIADIYKDIKQVFDPHGTLNPGVKVDVNPKEIVSLLRKEYSLEHLSDHLPRT
jgi:FAD/FMN-containing dehydrogenase